MKGFYCPYCAERYQIHIKKEDGQMICGHCGDSLRKVPLLKPRKFIALLASAALISPLGFMLYFSMENIYMDNKSENQELLAALNPVRSIKEWSGRVMKS